MTLTARAIEAVLGHQREAGQVGCRLRVSVVGGGCSGLSYALAYTHDEQPDDVRFAQGALVVLVDRRSLRHLEGATLDYLSSQRGGFSLEAPKVRGRCGCGVSFVGAAA